MNSNRLCIYFFYDKDGIVDDYIPYQLKSFREFFDEICFVVNGEINEIGRKKIAPYINKLLIKENKGMDAGAYKYAILHYGYAKLSTYEEVLCTNFTCFGPIFPLNELFETMASKKCDWWGLYRMYEKYKGRAYRHMTSFFVVYRKSILESQQFKEYWETLGDTSTYKLSVLNHEQRQTPYYDKCGFKNEVFIEDLPYKKYWPLHWTLWCADTLLIKEHFPFIKRRNFFFEYDRFAYPNVIKRVIPFIKNYTNYDFTYIQNNLKRTIDYRITKKVSKFKLLRYLIRSLISLSYKKRMEYKSRLYSYMHYEKLLHLLEQEKNLK